MEKERYFLDGPGETLVVMSDFELATPDPSKVIAVISAKRASFTYGVSEEKVTGGKSVVPRRKFTTEQTITFELEDCETDFRYFNLSQGITPTAGTTTVWAYGSDYRKLFGGSALEFDLGKTPEVNTLMVKNTDDGTVVPYSANTPVGTTLQLTGTTITAGSYYSSTPTEIECLFQYSATNSGNQVSSMTIDSVPPAVAIIHTMPMYDENNTVVGQQQIEVFKAQPSREFNQAYQEKAAFAPTMKFEVIDPRRPDKKLLDQKVVYPNS